MKVIGKVFRKARNTVATVSVKRLVTDKKVRAAARALAKDVWSHARQKNDQGTRTGVADALRKAWSRNNGELLRAAWAAVWNKSPDPAATAA